MTVILISRRSRRVIWLLVAAFCLGACGSGKRIDLVIANVSVLDLESGAATLSDVAVSGGRIAAVSAPGDTLYKAEVVDGAGKWLIPGLWDMHVHITDPVYFDLMIANGVVGARDMGGDNEQPGDGCGSVNIETLQGWREEIERGERIGPKLVLAGPVASARTWTEDEQPQRARAAVQEAARRGADFIKVYEDFTPDGFAALMDEASKVGLPVAGHASEETLTILEAIEAGQRSIEHVRSHLLVCFAESDEELIAFYDADDWNDDDRAWGARHRTDCDAVWSALRERKTWLTSTLAVESTQLAALNPGFEDDPRRDRFPNSVKMGAATHAERMRARLSDDDERAMSENWWRTQLKFAARAAAEDAPLLSGSDAVCEGVIPGDGLIAQLEFLVEAGLTPLEALQTATSEPAAYFERSDQQGRIAPGYEADLVLLNSDPRADIAALHDIEGVLVRGKFLGSDTVERLKRPVFRQ